MQNLLGVVSSIFYHFRPAIRLGSNAIEVSTGGLASLIGANVGN